MLSAGSKRNARRVSSSNRRKQEAPQQNSPAVRYATPIRYVASAPASVKKNRWTTSAREAVCPDAIASVSRRLAIGPNCCSYSTSPASGNSARRLFASTLTRRHVEVARSGR